MQTLIHPEVLRRFGRNPKIIFKRDGWKCVLCEDIEDLTIDHIDGNGRNSSIPNNKLSNLRTLCRKCHGREDNKRREKYHVPFFRNCLFCGIEFKTTYSRQGKYCSRTCSMNYRWANGFEGNLKKEVSRLYGR